MLALHFLRTYCFALDLLAFEPKKLYNCQERMKESL